MSLYLIRFRLLVDRLLRVGGWDNFRLLRPNDRKNPPKKFGTLSLMN